MRSHIDGLLGYLAIGEENVAATVGAANRVADKVEGLNFSGYGSELNGSRGWRSRDPCEGPWRLTPGASRRRPPTGSSLYCSVDCMPSRRYCQRPFGVESNFSHWTLREGTAVPVRR